MNTILLTGSSGFIGSHLCLLLLERGYTVFTVDSHINSSENTLNRVKKLLNEKVSIDNHLFNYRGDIRNSDILNRIFNEAIELKRPIDAVIHLAGLKSVKESTMNPINYWDNNVKGTINLVKIMSQFNCETIVFSSSATIYGNNNNLLSEKSLIKPVNTYGMTKMIVEKFLNDIFENLKDQWRIANIRYFNPIGAHYSGLIGESPLDTPNNIFPLLSNVALGKTEKLYVFGNDWPTPDGTPIRDYIHVMDLAESHIKVLEFLFSRNPQSLNLNIGTGKGTSVLELIKMFEISNNIKINFEFSERRLGDVPHLVADNKLACKLLNWRPQKTLREMCIDEWRFKRNNPKGIITDL